ncbi:antiterminator LoaP [Wukongibacter sp. M2B1]|uniref:antiterminator LoaP n=1 Tax=Wukongibacter sp. M2B1 TaxID=3088895 RepID=UPI003D7A7C49
MNWYVIFVKTGKEDDVEKHISYHFNKSECRLFIPKRRIDEKRKGKLHSVVKTLFPGYIFINANMNTNMYYIIKQVPKVYKILNKSNDFFTTIHNYEMQPILQLTQQSSIIDYSKGFIENSKICIKSGPLKGLEGLIKRIDKRKCRVKVSLDFMGSEKLVELGIELLKKPDEKKDNHFFLDSN